VRRGPPSHGYGGTANIVNLILLTRDELDAGGAITLTDARAAHLRRVLGVRVGQSVRVGIVDGEHGQGTVAAVDDLGVRMHCTFDSVIPPRPAADLLLALPRPKVLRRLWAQLAALGVGHIILTNAERVERNYFDTHVLTPACYGPLLLEGLQQARDTRVPRVSIHRQFRVLVEDELDRLSDATVRVAADPRGTPSLTTVVGHRSGERVLLAVGPEGGWNGFELSLLEAHGFEAAGMGPRPLRSDTACIALLSIVHAVMRR
jgi:16S rRNA (uracil1498-N3)-methyltransferase